MKIDEAIKTYLAKTNQRIFRPKAVLFDMDGVLYAWKEVADKYHLKAEESDFYLYEGRTGASTLDILYQKTFGRNATEEEIHRLYEEKSALFRAYNDGEAMPGAAEVLAKVKAAGLQRIVVTGSGQRSLIDKLEHTYPGIFEREKMVTAFDVKYGKPHPEPYLIGLQKAGVEANEAIVVENAPLGVQAGVAAGIFTIGVNTGPLADRVLREAGANLLFPSMGVLAQNIEEIIMAS